jgi:ketosteroid isomerase-like protein
VESENVRVVRRLYELYGALDPDPAVRTESDELRELMGFFAPDVEFTTVSDSPEAGIYRGREEIARSWGRWLAGVGRDRIEIEAIEERGDMVLALSRNRYETPHGVSTENRGGGVFTLSEGRIVRFTAALTWEGARELWNAASGD